MKDRDDLIESRIERIMGDDKWLKTEINELDRMFDDSEILNAIRSGDAANLGFLIMRMIDAQVEKTATQEIDEEAADREEDAAVDRYESRMENAA
jgi:hypothetical protein